MNRRYPAPVSDGWAETADLLKQLAALVERQPSDDDPLLDLAYVPRSALGPEHRWEVNVNLGPEAETGYWLGATPQDALRVALDDLTEYVQDPESFLKRAVSEDGA